MATDQNFRIKNGLTVGAVEVIDSSGKLTANAFGTNSNEKIEDVVADMITGSTHSNITVTYNDTNGTLAFSAAAQYGDSDVESYLDGGTSTPSFASQSTGLITSNIASNGILHDLQIGSSSKGKIRIVDGDVVIHSTPSGHTGIRLGNGYLAITNNAGAISNGSYDLGLDSYKFKDGYFSGTVNAGTISSGAITSSGYISAGETSGTSGGLVLASRYSGNDHIATISSMYSNGGWVLGYGAKAKNGASGFVSTFDNFSGARSYLRIQNSAIAIGYAPNQQTAVDSDLTSVSEPFVFTPSSGALSITGQLTASTVNTGQGATEVHLMNQNLRTSDSPTFGTITATSLNTGHGNNELYAMNQNVRTTDSVTFNQVTTTNNGSGTNFKVGDDAWIGDINVANTIRVSGAQNANNGYIAFGNSSNTALGRAGTGQLTWGADEIYHEGHKP